MMTEAHRRLAKRINQSPAPLKNMATEVFYEILDILFTEEEAAVVADMPRAPATAQKVAGKLRRPVDEIAPILERLADRAVIFSYGEGDAKKYFVFPIFPGVYEMQFWKRPDSEETLRLARLYDELYDQEFAENLMKKDSRVFRIMPSEGSLPVEKTGVLPSDSLHEVIERHDAWSLANFCACRRQRNMLGDGCDKPQDVCMQFGVAAHYIEKKGFGRMVSKPEILDALDRAEDAGLIHFVDNVELPVIACNCCACCCVSLANLTRFNTPSMFTESRFLPELNEPKCKACGACTKFCITGALHLYNEKLIFERWRCIGCGICASKCKHGALGLVPRPEALPVPQNYGQMFVDVGNEWMGASRPGDARALKINRSVGNLLQMIMRKFA
jgi:Pyruvate/2-oxoacid:ferredoxin oxidoreductase delta subunit